MRTSSKKFSHPTSHQGLTQGFVVRGKPCLLKMDDVRLLRYCYMLIHATSHPDGGHRHQYQCEITNSRISPLTARCKKAVNIPNIRKRTLSLTPSAASLHSSLSTVNRLRDGRPRNWDLILDRRENISLIRDVQTGSGAYPASYAVCKGKGCPMTRLLSHRGEAELLLQPNCNLGARRWVVSSTPRPLYPRERFGTQCIGGLADVGVSLDGHGQSRPQWNSPDRPARSESLYRLSYPGTHSVGTRDCRPQHIFTAWCLIKHRDNLSLARFVSRYDVHHRSNKCLVQYPFFCDVALR